MFGYSVGNSRDAECISVVIHKPTVSLPLNKHDDIHLTRR
jgi:hypothetical protein